MRTVWIGLVCILLAPWAATQPRGASDDITVNLFVNYGFAYRNGSWAPVDVVVDNDKVDIKGWLEVRTHRVDGPQSPVYRVPIESPRGSQKRFQVHCLLRNTEYIDAQLYDGRRAVLDVPARWQAAPIEDRDLLALVLDDEGGNGFGFVYSAVNLAGVERGFHRETLGTEELGYLSTHPRAYDAVDLILFGKIDPEKVGARQREILLDYARNGGTVVVCTGKNAKFYRGTWVEDLLGVEIGPEEPVREGDFAQAVFEPDEMQGVRPERECVVANLTPRAPDVKSWGRTRALATRRSVGSGHVYAFAIDVEERALQDAQAFSRLWSRLCVGRSQTQRLNYEAASHVVSETLPLVSGVVIHSKSSVMKYLALYLLVGVIGNWVFFSWLKRREWAWAMLVVFSFVFTAYAMVYGTSGRAQSSELEQMDVLRVTREGGITRRDSFVGVLTAHSATYDMQLVGENALARDLIEDWASTVTPRRGAGLGGSSRPFRLVQGEQSRIDGLRIGASDIRLMRVESDIPLPGGIEGELVLDESGLTGKLTNRTGRNLDGQDAFVFLDGQLLRVNVAEGRIEVNQPAELLRYRAPDMAEPFVNPVFRGGYAQPVAAASLRRWMVGYLLGAEPLQQPWGAPGTAFPLRRDLGPFLVAWAAPGSSESAVKPTEAIRRKLNETLIVADIQVRRDAVPDESARPLEAWLQRVTSHDDTWNERYAREGWKSPEITSCRETCAVMVRLPDSVSVHKPSLLLDLYWRCQTDGHSLVFQPEGTPAEWWKGRRIEQAVESDGVTHRDTYRVEWQDISVLPVESGEFYNLQVLPHLINTPQGDFRNEYGYHPLCLSMPPIFRDMESSGLIFKGTVLRPPDETVCNKNIEHEYAVAVIARALMPSAAAAGGEEARWR